MYIMLKDRPSITLTFWRKVDSFSETGGGALEDLGSLPSYHHLGAQQGDQHGQAVESDCHNGVTGIAQAQQHLGGQMMR